MADYMTVVQVARVLKVTRTTVYNWHEDGRFPNATEAHEAVKTILIPASDVELVREQEAQKSSERIKELGFWVEWGKENRVGNDPVAMPTAI